MAQFLVQHGVFNKLNDIKDIVNALVLLLNGTTDFYSPEQKDYYFNVVKAQS